MKSILHSMQLGFGDFFVTHRGYMQDRQMSFPRETVSTFGLLLADRIIGPFSLEIQYIKAIRTLVPTARESQLPVYLSSAVTSFLTSGASPAAPFMLVGAHPLQY